MTGGRCLLALSLGALSFIANAPTLVKTARNGSTSCRQSGLVESEHLSHALQLRQQLSRRQSTCRRFTQWRGKAIAAR